MPNKHALDAQRWYEIAGKANQWGYDCPSDEHCEIWFFIAIAANVEGNLALDKAVRCA